MGKINISSVVSASSIGLLGLLYLTPLYGGDIEFRVEEPQPNSVMTGVSNIRGWAVSTAGIDRIELYAGGEYKTDIPWGGSRKDVGNAYPGYPEADNSGFSMAYNYNLRSAGSNLITIKVYDNDGAMQEIDVPYNVTRFQDSFITDPTDINILKLSDLVVSGSRSITMRGADVQGEKQDIRLDWQTAKQNFSITSVLPADQGAGASLDGVYTLSRLTLWYGAEPNLPSGAILDTEAESTMVGGIPMSITAAGMLTVEGSAIRTSVKATISGGGLSETIDETEMDTLVADEGYAITYRDSFGTTSQAILLQRGTYLIWLEYFYGDPEEVDGVAVLQWQKSVEVSEEDASSQEFVATAPYGAANATDQPIQDTILQSVRNLLQEADR